MVPIKHGGAVFAGSVDHEKEAHGDEHRQWNWDRRINLFVYPRVIKLDGIENCGGCDPNCRKRCYYLAKTRYGRPERKCHEDQCRRSNQDPAPWLGSETNINPPKIRIETGRPQFPGEVEQRETAEE